MARYTYGGSDCVRWGVIGLGWFGEIHADTLAGMPGIELAALCTRRAERLNELADRYGASGRYTDYKDLLADPSVDAVSITTHVNDHRDIAIDALRAGKHVLLEKPMALTSAEVRAVGEAALKAGRVVAEAFMYRHHPQTLKVQELLAAGAIGELKWIHGYFTYKLIREGNYRWTGPYGGGSLWDVGCYPISYARMATGQAPMKVTGWQTFTAEGADLSFSGQMVYPCGAVAQIYSSFDLPLRTQMELHGSEGTLIISQPFTPRDTRIPLVLKDKNGGIQRFTFRKTDLYLGEVQDMENAILEGTRPRISLKESEENIATILALYQSAHLHGEPVSLPGN